MTSLFLEPSDIDINYYLDFLLFIDDYSGSMSSINSGLKNNKNLNNVLFKKNYYPTDLRGNVARVGIDLIGGFEVCLYAYCYLSNSKYHVSINDFVYYRMDSDFDFNVFINAYASFKRAREFKIQEYDELIKTNEDKIKKLNSDCEPLDDDLKNYGDDYYESNTSYKHKELLNKTSALKSRVRFLKEYIEQDLIKINLLKKEIEEIERNSIMLKELILKAKSKSSCLKTRVSVTEQIFNFVDSQGKPYNFKLKTLKNKFKKVEDAGNDFLTSSTVIHMKNSKEEIVRVTSSYGAPQITMIERQKVALAGYYDFDVNDVNIYSEKGCVYIALGSGSASSNKLPEKIEARKDAFEKGFFTLGYDETGKPVRIGVYDMGHTLVGGMSGSGKSSLQNMLIASLYNSIEYVEHMYLVDFKRGVEFAPFEKVEGTMQTVISTISDFSRLAESLVNLMNNRLDEMKEQNVRDYAGKAIYVFLDEYAIIENQKAFITKEEYALIQSSINSLMQMSRAAKIFLLFGVQKATEKQLPSFIKGQAKTRFLFRVDESTTASNVMGSGWSESGLSATAFPTGAFAIRLNGDYKMLKSGFISDDVLPSFLSFCSSQVASVSITNEHACEHRQE